MSRIEKVKERFLSCPDDFTWNELVRLLKSFGYEMKSGSGSVRKFRADGLPAVNLHEPHPSTVVKRYALRQVREMLESEGLI